jgi:hypothetical protein
MHWKNGIIDGPQYAAVMGVAGFVAALFWFRPPGRAATAEPPREADK